MKRRAFLGLAGGAVAWPLIARAQQPERTRRVGILMSTAETDPLEVSSVNAFTAELAKLGWVQGKNLDLIVRWGAADGKRMTANAEELVSLGSDVILAKGATVPSARQATTTIPIVFVSLPDPIVQPLVGSFSHPVGNITGFTTYEYGLVGKRLSLLRDFAAHQPCAVYPKPPERRRDPVAAGTGDGRCPRNRLERDRAPARSPPTSRARYRLSPPVRMEACWSRSTPSR